MRYSLEVDTMRDISAEEWDEFTSEILFLADWVGRVSVGNRPAFVTRGRHRLRRWWHLATSKGFRDAQEPFGIPPS